MNEESGKMSKKKSAADMTRSKSTINSSSSKHRVLRIIISVTVALLILFCAFELWISRHWLTVSHYELTSEKINHPFRVVQLTDLHNSVFGDDIGV